MILSRMLDELFPAGHNVRADGCLLRGEGVTASGVVEVTGTRDGVMVGAREAVLLSRMFLDTMRRSPGRPILMLVDNSGQRMALEDELAGLNMYVAHLVKTQDLARRRGHKVLSLVYGNSIAGGFIAFGLCAGRVHALPDARTSVMALPAMARVTKLSLEQLESMSATAPVFAPGVENFFRTGGIHGVWTGDLNACLENALAEPQDSDDRAALGAARGGRKLAARVAERVENE